MPTCPIMVFGSTFSACQSDTTSWCPHVHVTAMQGVTLHAILAGQTAVHKKLHAHLQTACYQWPISLLYQHQDTPYLLTWPVSFSTKLLRSIFVAWYCCWPAVAVCWQISQLVPVLLCWVYVSLYSLIWVAPICLLLSISPGGQSSPDSDSRSFLS